MIRKQLNQARIKKTEKKKLSFSLKMQQLMVEINKIIIINHYKISDKSFIQHTALMMLRISKKYMPAIIRDIFVDIINIKFLL